MLLWGWTFSAFTPVPQLGLRIIQRVYGNVWVLKTLGDQTFMCVFSRHTNVPSDPGIGHICLVSLWRHCTCGEFFCISPPLFGLEGTVPLILRFLMIKHSKKYFLKFNYFYFACMYECFAYMTVYHMCVLCLQSLEDLQMMAGNLHVGAENCTWVISPAPLRKCLKVARLQYAGGAPEKCPTGYWMSIKRRRPTR